MKERMRLANKTGQAIPEDLGLDSDTDYDMSKNKRKKTKKKKKRVGPSGEPIERDLLMAKAYGALSSTAVDKIMMEKRKKEA